ncbi:MAG: hypothetical protein V1723_00895 [Candidatus Uhrbacteria bacterium]
MRGIVVVCAAVALTVAAASSSSGASSERKSVAPFLGCYWSAMGCASGAEVCRWDDERHAHRCVAVNAPQEDALQKRIDVVAAVLECDDSWMAVSETCTATWSTPDAPSSCVEAVRVAERTCRDADIATMLSQEQENEERAELDEYSFVPLRIAVPTPAEVSAGSRRFDRLECRVDSCLEPIEAVESMGIYIGSHRANCNARIDEGRKICDQALACANAERLEFGVCVIEQASYRDESVASGSKCGQAVAKRERVCAAYHAASQNAQDRLNHQSFGVGGFTIVF